ncbi:glycosyl hydrolase family 8 [Spirochaeta cellobiosiphila]|uniref:glycosyl hydrolase family 8 n=1 Tax=Spirochaeta cellobiosiphila TaxID=504483 RepID=UPI00041C03E5|nr:glycosyl hydrolase family 8 [Spirochaeta cellobiosiphila]
MNSIKRVFIICLFSSFFMACAGSIPQDRIAEAISGPFVPTSIIKPSLEQSKLDAQLLNFYREWKSFYLKQGCGPNRYLVDVSADGNKVEGGTAPETLTISEAHGYGMLISVMMADFDPESQKIFDGMVSYFHDHPARSNPGLMAWNQLSNCQDAGDDVGGYNSASDGDLDIAYALLLADRKWGSEGPFNYKKEALKVISAIKELDIDPDNHFVRIGDWVNRVDEGQYAYTTRSSDFMVSHFKAFGDFTGDSSWYAVRDTTYSIMDSISSSYSSDTYLIPDFIVGLPENPQPADPWFLEGSDDGLYSWNAARYPWRIALDYLLYDDDRAFQALMPLNVWIKRVSDGLPENIADTYSLNGKYSRKSGFDSMAFVSMFAVAATIDESNQQWLDDLWQDINEKSISDEDYYGNTLKLLAMITITGHWTKP